MKSSFLTTVGVAFLILGFAAAFYAFILQLGVKSTTASLVTLKFEVLAGSDGMKIYGQHPTPTTPAVPARGVGGEEARIRMAKTEEKYNVHFLIRDEDAENLAHYFKELAVLISIYPSGISGAPPEAVIKLAIVSGGSPNKNIDEYAALKEEHDWDCVIEVYYTTRETVGYGKIPIYVYLEEA